jgi:hypothetical protein
VEWRIFAGEGSRSDVAVNFVRRNVYDARYRQFSGNFQEGESSSDISLNYRRRLVDTAVEVGFGGEVDHDIASGHCDF